MISTFFGLFLSAGEADFSKSISLTLLSVLTLLFELAIERGLFLSYHPVRLALWDWLLLLSHKRLLLMSHERLLLWRHKVGLAELAAHNCLHLIRVHWKLSVHRHHPWESHLKHRWIQEGLLLAGHREAAIRHGSINHRVPPCPF